MVMQHIKCVVKNQQKLQNRTDLTVEYKHKSWLYVNGDITAVYCALQLTGNVQLSDIVMLVMF